MIRKAALTLVIALAVAATARVGAQAAPGAPRNLQANVFSGGRVFLAWAAAPGAVTTYLVEVGAAPGISNLAVFDTGSATPGFNASGVPPGSYFVRVRAANGSAVGPASNEIRVDVPVPPCVPPRAPSGLIASIDGTNVTLQWGIDVSVTTVVLEAGSAPAQSDVFVGDIGRRSSITASAAPGTYLVRVRGRSACGALSEPSNEVSVTVLGAEAITIRFDGLTGHGSPFDIYSESGFTVERTAASWVTWTMVGNPAPAVVFRASSPLTGELTVTAEGRGFTFTAADLYSSTTRIPYTFIGIANSNVVFTASAELPNTFGGFATVLNPHRDTTIDTLIIRLHNCPPGPCSSTNPMGIDNIVVRY
jgi:hypothetical protein